MFIEINIVHKEHAILTYLHNRVIFQSVHMKFYNSKYGTRRQSHIFLSVRELLNPGTAYYHSHLISVILITLIIIIIAPLSILSEESGKI